MVNRLWLLKVALLVSLLGPVPAPAVDIEQHLNQIVRAGDLRDTRVAMMVMDLDSGQQLAALNADEPMIPASNMKVITTAAALDVLGPDFMFRTELRVIEPLDPPGAGSADGPGVSEIGTAGLNGAILLVRGDGDPAFGDPKLLSEHGLVVDELFEQWTRAVAGTGIRRFDRLVVDDQVFDRQFVHPAWPKADLVRYYGAQVAGLNFYLNCLEVLPVPTVVGEAPRIELFPTAPFLETVNRAKTGGRDLFSIDRRLGTNELIFAGSIRNRRSEPFRVTVHDPPIFFARLLALHMSKQGIEVGVIARASDEAPLAPSRLLHLVQTSISQVLNRTNRDSQNLFAEALLKRMGRQVTGRPGSWRQGAAAVRMALRKSNRLDTGTAALCISDGSGLTRDNRVTARLLVELLRSMHRDPAKAAIFRDSLSLGGTNGTLRDRFGDLHGQVFAKSGYLRGVSGLSGYLVLPAFGRGQPEPRTIGFSFLFNGFDPHKRNYDIKNLQDKLVTLIDQALTDPVPLGG